MHKIKILYADGEPNNLTAFLAYFRRVEQYQISILQSSIEIVDFLERDCPHILIIDQVILEEIGLPFFEMKEGRELILIAVTTSSNLDFLDSAVREGKIFKYHCKPLVLDDLNILIQEVIDIISQGYCDV